MSHIQNQLLEFEELFQFMLDADDNNEMAQRLLIIKQRLGTETFKSFTFYISRLNQEQYY